MDALLYVGIGGFLGASARYLMTLWTDSLLMPHWGDFPFGTLAVNLLGSFGLALFSAWFASRAGLPAPLRLLVGTGFFGAFTTFATFASDSISLLQQGGWLPFALNILLNNGLCLAGVGLGLLAAQHLLESPL